MERNSNLILPSIPPSLPYLPLQTMMVSVAFLLASLLVATVAAAPADDSSLVAELITANTQVTRIKDVGVSAWLCIVKIKN